MKSRTIMWIFWMDDPPYNSVCLYVTMSALVYIILTKYFGGSPILYIQNHKFRRILSDWRLQWHHDMAIWFKSNKLILFFESRKMKSYHVHATHFEYRNFSSTLLQAQVKIITLVPQRVRNFHSHKLCPSRRSANIFCRIENE